MISDSLNYTTDTDIASQQSPDWWEDDIEDPDRKYDHKMYVAALAFCGLPPDYDRSFQKYLWTDEKTGKQKVTLRSCNVSKACVVDHAAVWTQVNEPYPNFAIWTSKDGKHSGPKKAQNSDIQFIRNVTLDAEYPQAPHIAHSVGRKLADHLVRLGIIEPNHPIDDTGAGFHLVIPIVQIEIPKNSPPEISTLWNGAVARVVKTLILPEFDRLCQEAGIEMDLEAFDISRILSFPGTWRPTNPDKDDADFLKDGYLRHWLEPYVDGNYPVRKENAKLTQLVQDAFIELQSESKESAKKGKEQLRSNPHASPNDLTDDALIQKIMSSKNGIEFTRLWYGDIGTDWSSADLALCNFLAFWTGKDPSRMDHLFRQSGLMRDKWDRKARTGEIYGEGTIQRAIEGCYETYDPNYGKDTEPLEEETITFEQIEKLLLEAIEKQQNAEVIYALTDIIATFTAQEQATIGSIIERNKKKIPGFKPSSYNNCLKASKDAMKQKKSEERNHHSGDDGYSPYYASDGSMWMAVEPTERNPEPDPIQLSNFTGVIVADVTTDDGAEKKRSYELETNRSGRVYRFDVPVEELARCEWVDIRMGARASVTVGRQRKEHLAAAIKSVSGESVIEKNQYAHTGWRKIDGIMVYLHNDGCLSEVSEIASEKINHLTHSFFSSASAFKATPKRDNLFMSEVSEVSEVNIEASVKLTGSLSNYMFPSERENIQQSIRASLAIVDITQDTITMPLYAGLCRSVLGEVDLGIHVAGGTGQGKSQIVALIQQHFGASMDALHLPGSWESTENALEMKLFQAKDAIFVADDFKPKGSRNSQDQLHGKADRVFRQIGNHQARGRLDANLNNRVERVPRCLLLSTGEDIPKGQSCQARMIVIVMTESITKGEAAKRLSISQRDARDGLYAQAMAGYIEWLAPRIEAIQSQWPSFRDQERDQLSGEGHSRSGTNTANLILGMKCFLQYACEMGAITPQEAENYLSRCKVALAGIASEASANNHQMRPSEQWKRLLASAISGNHAHLVTPIGDNPGPGYGWRKSVRSYINSEGNTTDDETFSGGGSQIGWIDGDDIYLDPTTSYATVLAEGSRSGDNITTSKDMLIKDLVKDNVLASTDLHKDVAHRSTTIRKRLQGSQKYVLHIKKETLFPNDPLPESPHSSHSSHSEGSKPACEEALGVSEVPHSQASEGGDFSHSDENQRPPRPHPLCHPDANWVKDDLLGVFTCEVCNHG